MSQPSWPQPQPPKPKMSRKRKAAFWVGGVFAAFIVLGVIGEATGAGKKQNTGNSANTQTIVAVDTASSPAAQSSPSPAAPSSPAAVPHTSAAAVKPKPSSASPTCDMTKEPDVYVWYKVPGLQDTAQELGGWDPETCKSSIPKIMAGLPTGAGYCSEIGYVSDNPGYNADATPAKPLKHIVEEVGGSC